MNQWLFLFFLFLFSQNIFAGYEFIENNGQWKSNVKYRVGLPNGSLFLEKNALTYHFYDYSQLIKFHGKSTLDVKPADILLKSHAYRVTFLNASEFIDILPDNKNNQYYNYFIGSDSSKWASHVSSYKQVTYQNIYPKIDLVLYEYKNGLKYDFIIHPGGDIQQIQLKYEGADHVFLKNNELYIKTSISETIEEKPVFYQTKQGKISVISGKYVLKNNILTFETTQAYDKNRPLTIDPALIFASYSGSTADNFGMTATYDQDGNLYSGGTAFDIGYPVTPGAFQTSFANIPSGGITDVVISKYSATGTTHIYSTYLGGDGTELANSMVVNDQNELFIYGPTSSSNFPMLGGSFDNTFNGGNGVYFISNGANFVNGTDIYISKLNVSGTALLGSTYLGGSSNDGINYNINPTLYDSLMFNYGDQSRGEIILDNLGNCYITSSSRSNDFPVLSAFDASFNGQQDAVICKLNTTLTTLIYSSYLGGSEKDAGYSIKVDDTFRAYVCGGTASTNFPTTGGVLNTTYQGGKTDGYIVKVSPNGSTIEACTYIGTNTYDQTYFVELDDNNDIYILGQSLGNMPVINAAYSNANSKQFIQKTNNSLTNIIYSSVFGNGTNSISLSPSAFLVDQCQNIYISGWGGNILTGIPMNNMPTTLGSLYPTSPNGFDFYFSVFERNMNSLLYASYFGGNQSEEHVDGGTSRFDKKGIIYQSVCAGCGSNSDFPTTPGVVSQTNNSFNCNNGVFKFDFETVVQAEFTSSDTQACTSVTVFITNQSSGANAYDWDFGNGTGTTSPNDTSIVYTNPGVYVISLIATDTICQISDTVTKTIEIFQNVSVNQLPDTFVCPGDSVTYTVLTNGTANQYIWSSNGQFTDTLNTNILDSLYTFSINSNETLYIQVGNGSCSQTDTVIVQTISLTGSTSNTFTECGLCTGTASVNISGGCLGCTYLWSDPNAQTTSTALNLCVGNYNVTVTHPQGCEDVFSTSISDTSSLSLTTINTNPNLCFGNCQASASVTAVGGTAPYTYLWSDAAAQTNSIATNLCAGTYTVTITDSLLCQKTSSITVTQPAMLQIANAQVNNVLCYQDCNGSVALTISGGTAPYTYVWNDPNAQTGPTLMNVCAGSYSVSITDANNCPIDSVFSILQAPALVANFTSSPPLCFNICNGTIEAMASGGTQPYEYQWTSGGSFLEDSLIVNICPGEYLVSVRDSNGCIVSDSVRLETNDFHSFPVFLSADKDTIVQYETTYLHAQPSENETYIWSPASTLNDANLLNPLASPLQTTTYTFTVIDNLNPQCRFDSSITIYVLDYICNDPSIFVPNAFTPNGDGKNDVLILRGLSLEEVYFTIYNRWGEKVFETSDVTVGWNGIYRDRPCDPGVFDYYLKATCPNQEKIFLKGNITLIR